MKYKGREAIEKARELGLLLNKYCDPIEDARDDLTIEEAEDVAREDSNLIWLDAGNIINGITVSIDLHQGYTENDRKFGYLCGDEGGFFFTWMDTIGETIDTVEEDEISGSGGLNKHDVQEFLRKYLDGYYVSHFEMDG